MASSSNAENSSKASRISFKTKFKQFGWLFGNPLETFDNLISTSTEISWPTDQNIMQHWMYLVDERRDNIHVSDDFYSSITWDIVNNLVAFWELYSPKELR